ncbi:MAG: hypothetical protein WC854_11400 [Bacteroidales bacterium]
MLFLHILFKIRYGKKQQQVGLPRYLQGNEINGSLMFALIRVLLIWGIAMILYRKKVLIRL